MFLKTVFVSLLFVAAALEEQGTPPCQEEGGCGTSGQSLLQKKHGVLKAKVEEDGEGADVEALSGESNEGADDEVDEDGEGADVEALSSESNESADDEGTDQEGVGFWRRRRRSRRRRNRRRGVHASSKVTSSGDCSNKGGSHYNDCGGIKYCCGVCHGQTTCDNNGGLLHCACTQEAEHKAAAQEAAAAAAQAEAEKEAEANDKATEAAKAAAKEEEADKAEAEAAEKATAEREAAEAAAELAAACEDTAGEATDVYDYACADYPRCLAYGDSSYTHDYDDDDFTAADMCAACKKQSCSDNDQDDPGTPRGS